MQSFSELPLSAPIAKAITELGFEKPSEIQAQALPILLGESTDFLGLAATGTGKTAAFAIPMLERVQPKIRAVQTLILCPTRELALQVAEQVNLLGKYKGIRTVAVYGGASYVDQIRGLKEGANVVVGTPGRVCDHIDRGTLRLDQVTTLILDEADEMISMGFKDDLEKVLAAAPRAVKKKEAADGEAVVETVQCNIWLFSATMSREVRHVADDYLRNPKQVQVNRKEMVPSTIEQYYYPTQESNKPDILCKLIEAADDFYGLVFCQTKALVVELTQYLHERGYKVDSLHGDKDQNARERTMLAFRNRKATILVCTDVASRGLDVKDITHVINYSLPRELDNYVHRIGRTARSGKTGIAMNLVTMSHRRLITQIENMTKTRMLEGQVPSRREIGARKVSNRLTDFTAQTNHARALEVMSEEWKTALAEMTSEEVAGRFLNMMMPDVFNDPVRAERPPRAEGTERQTIHRGARPVIGRPSAHLTPSYGALPDIRPRVTAAPPVARPVPVTSDEEVAPVARRAAPVAPTPVLESKEESSIPRANRPTVGGPETPADLEMDDFGDPVDAPVVRRPAAARAAGPSARSSLGPAKGGGSAPIRPARSPWAKNGGSSERPAGRAPIGAPRGPVARGDSGSDRPYSRDRNDRTGSSGPSARSFDRGGFAPRSSEGGDRPYSKKPRAFEEERPFTKSRSRSQSDEFSAPRSARSFARPQSDEGARPPRRTSSASSPASRERTPYAGPSRHAAQQSEEGTPLNRRARRAAKFAGAAGPKKDD